MRRMFSSVCRLPGKVFSRIFCSEILRKLNNIESHLSYIEDLHKVSHNISAVPKAVGHVRLLQLANLAFLKQVTDMLDANGVPYWLGSGTLIGAVRHKGFIPWDDDIDICTTREFHNRLMELIENEYGIGGEVFATKGDCIRIFKRGTPCQIDVFAWDELNVPDLSEKTLEAVRRAHDSFCVQFQYDFSQLNVFGRTITNKTDSEILAMASGFSSMFSGPCRIVMEGIEESHHTFLWMPREILFPTSRIEFEGFQFNAPTEPGRVLERWYGDYMAYPSGFHIHSDIMRRLTPSALDKMRMMVKSVEGV